MAADIPTEKLSNPTFNAFLETYTTMKIPERTTLQKNYVPKVYDEVMESIRKEIDESPIWVSIDETTDSCGRYVGNVVIGKLNSETPGRSFLLTCELLEKTNASTIAQLFCSSLELLWNGKIHHDRVLLFVSDAARYMTKAGNSLKVLFPKMIHVTCVDHGLHRVAEEIRATFSNVDHLIANVKKFFVKTPSRIHAFKEALAIPLPPQPVLTRWGTWLDAALYYSENFEKIKEFVGGLDPEDAASIGAAQELLSMPSVRDDLAVIATNFSAIPRTITELESAGQSLSESISQVAKIEKHVYLLKAKKLQKIVRKMTTVLENNKGFQVLRVIERIGEGEASMSDIDADLEITISDVAHLKYALIVSCPVAG